LIVIFGSSPLIAGVLKIREVWFTVTLNTHSSLLSGGVEGPGDMWVCAGLNARVEDEAPFILSLFTFGVL